MTTIKTIEVHVYDEARMPIVGAKVTPSTKEVLAVTVLTDDTGSAIVDLHNPTFWVKKEGYIERRLEFSGASPHFEVVLRESSTRSPSSQSGSGTGSGEASKEDPYNPLPTEPQVYGTVTDASNKPIVGANVYETDANGNVQTNSETQRAAITQTNQYGEYVASGNATHILVEKQDYINQIKPVPQLSADNTSNRIRLDFVLQLQTNENPGGDEPIIAPPSEISNILSKIPKTWLVVIAAVGLGILLKSD